MTKVRYTLFQSIFGDSMVHSFINVLVTSSITRPYRAVSNVSGTDASLTAVPGVGSLIPAQSDTFLEIDNETIAPPFR